MCRRGFFPFSQLLLGAGMGLEARTARWAKRRARFEDFPPFSSDFPFSHTHQGISEHLLLPKLLLPPLWVCVCGGEAGVLRGNPEPQHL